MSAQPRKPSDVSSPSSRFGPSLNQSLVEPCDRLDSCPHGDMLKQILANQEIQTIELHDLRTFIAGSLGSPGLLERIRLVERVVQILAWSVGVALTAAIALAVTNVLS